MDQVRGRAIRACDNSPECRARDRGTPVAEHGGMKKNHKPLSLTREPLRTLASVELTGAGGGMYNNTRVSALYTGCTSCPSCGDCGLERP